MMIVCFIRSDDTEGWNNKCSNPVPVPVSQVSQEGRGCPTAAAAVGAAVPGHPSTLQPWHIPSGLAVAELAAQPGMGSSPPSTAPALPTLPGALPPFLHWTKLHLLGHFWSNSCQQGKNRDFLPIYCIKLAFQADILQHTHCNMLRENCFAPSNSCHWWCCPASPHQGHEHGTAAQGGILTGSYLHKSYCLNKRLTDQTPGKKYPKV